MTAVLWLFFKGLDTHPQISPRSLKFLDKKRRLLHRHEIFLEQGEPALPGIKHKEFPRLIVL
jgi:hypothetical protein